MERVAERDNFIERLEKTCPICSTCKKVRSEDSRCFDVEEYIDDISSHMASHGICPDCLGAVYEEVGIEPPPKEDV